jgi:hypothetical protein
VVLVSEADWYPGKAAVRRSAERYLRYIQDDAAPAF